MEVEGRSAAKDPGQTRLEAMGYKQELNRDLSMLANFALSFAVISILTGCTTLYGIGLNFGGTSSIIYGWLTAGFFSCFVAVAMGEICSSFPTSGGLYYWSYALAGPKWGPFASWMTGWFNLIGQVTGTCSITFSLAQMLQVIILLATGGGNGGGYYASKYVVVAIHGGLVTIHALINSLWVGSLSYLVAFAAAWNIIGVFVLMIVVPVVAVHRPTADFVFTSFNTDNGDGIHSYPYIFAVSLLMAQYTLAAYDSSAHMSEETKGGDRNGAYGLMLSVVVSVVVGWLYLVGITFAVVDPAHLLDPGNDARGYAIAQAFYDAFRDRYGHGGGGIVCLGVVSVAIFCSGMSMITSNSRMLFAFSRDGAVPFWRLWRKVDKRNVPLPAVWMSAFGAFAFALPYLGSAVAFQATVSITTIGLYISYALPIFFRLTVGRRSFVPGPFHLGRFSPFVGWVAVLWVCTITPIFCLPSAYPITRETFNYAPVMVGGVFILALGSWFLSARYWFNGPYSLANHTSVLGARKGVQNF